MTVVKESTNELEIRYSFEQVITRKGEVQHPFEKEKYMVITQPLIKIDHRWTSPPARVEIEVKKKVP